ncbi:MAG: rhodanese-like domain-containing protein [Salinivirgaceae bacterium]|nr:rhodanese-like domain-containing protein [Salinivirgaceae bacterium]
MNDLEKVISQMDFQYFGTGQHKIETEEFFRKEGAILLDVRAPEEIDTIKLKMEHHCQVLEIPTNEVPVRLDEIPKDKFIGIFCSSGVRCTVIFAYLKSKGYEHVRILPGGYASFIDAVLPGKIFKKINS